MEKVYTDEIDGYEIFQSSLQVHLTTGPEKQQSHDKLSTVHIYHTNGKKAQCQNCVCAGVSLPTMGKVRI